MRERMKAKENPEVDFSLLRRIAKSLSNLLKPFCEVVVHDLKDLEHSIICIEGNVTGRSLGGGPTNLILSKMLAEDTDKDLSNYITTMPNGRLVKSSTIFLKEDNGKVSGAFCINLDITDFYSFNAELREFLFTEDVNAPSEFFSDNIQKTIKSVFEETLRDMALSSSSENMNREDKINLVNRLHHKGIFRVRKSVPILADLLGVTRATIYNYLKESDILEL